MKQWISGLLLNKQASKIRHAQERKDLRAARAQYIEAITKLQSELLLEIPQILVTSFNSIDKNILKLTKKYNPTEKIHSRKILSKQNSILQEHYALLIKKQHLLQTYTLKYELKKLNQNYLKHLERLKQQVGDPIPASINQSLIPFDSVSKTLPALMSIPLLSDLSRHLEQLQTYKATLEAGIHYLQDHLTNASASSSYSEASSLPESEEKPVPKQGLEYGLQYMLFLINYFKDYLINCIRNCFTPRPTTVTPTEQAPTTVTLSAQQKQFTPYLEARFKRWVAEARVRAQQTQTIEKAPHVA